MSAKILVTEDEGIVAADIEDRLKRLGYDVIGTVDTGEAALKKVGEIQPDLILMDIMIKGDIDGIEAATRIREAYDIPVIFLTAYSDDPTFERAKITEPFGYLLKPFEERELRTTIEIALYKHRMEKEREKLITELRAALTKVKVLTGLLPICASCKKIRDDQGYWSEVENYIRERSEAEFTHGFCPDCADRLLKGYLKNNSK